MSFISYHQTLYNTNKHGGSQTFKLSRKIQLTVFQLIIFGILYNFVAQLTTAVSRSAVINVSCEVEQTVSFGANPAKPLFLIVSELFHVKLNN